MAQALYAPTEKGKSPFFVATGVVLYSKGTVLEEQPFVHFVVESQNGFHTCQTGVKFNLNDPKDKKQLDIIAQLLGNCEFHEDMAGKHLRFVARHTKDGTLLKAVVHPAFDLALVLNGKLKLVSLTTALKTIE